jgi:hypothetical protein
VYAGRRTFISRGSEGLACQNCWRAKRFGQNHTAKPQTGYEDEDERQQGLVGKHFPSDGQVLPQLSGQARVSVFVSTLRRHALQKNSDAAFSPLLRMQLTVSASRVVLYRS